MATEKNSGVTDRGSVLTTELNSLANGSYSAAGAAYDNTTQLDTWAIAEMLLKGISTPTLNAPIHLYAVSAPDGTNYEDGSSSLRPPDDSYVGTFQVYNNSSDQRLQTRPFKLKPVKMKFILYNGCGQAFAASANVVKLFTFNRTIN